ncbi:MAG: ABC transporter permease subunit [Bacteroidetes bacterium]|jgi:putative spermidine/putrescine transport system permease protein|nr:ABC transporter permease subunit [Bacteroidota bacterium]NBC26761.1 ABC transporter permease subunit [Bacteroidota bacterium]
MTKKLLITLFIAGCLVPLGLAIGYSLLYSVGLAGLLSNGVTFEHWIALFRGEFLQSILYSVWVAAASTLLAMGISLTLLFTARRLFRSRNLYRALFLPLTIPPIVLAFVIFQLYSGSGLFSRLAFQMGFISEIQQFPVLVQDPYATGIIMAHVFLVFPFFLLVLLNLYEHEKLDQIEAVASSLGAGKRTILLHLQLPVLLRGMFPLIALYFIFFMGAYEIPLLLGQSSPHMISVLILEKLQRYNLANIPVAHSMAVWYAVLCIATISWLFSRYRQKVAV